MTLTSFRIYLKFAFLVAAFLTGFAFGIAVFKSCSREHPSDLDYKPIDTVVKPIDTNGLSTYDGDLLEFYLRRQTN